MKKRIKVKIGNKKNVDLTEDSLFDAIGTLQQYVNLRHRWIRNDIWTPYVRVVQGTQGGGDL